MPPRAYAIPIVVIVFASFEKKVRAKRREECWGKNISHIFMYPSVIVRNGSCFLLVLFSKPHETKMGSGVGLATCLVGFN